MRILSFALVDNVRAIPLALGVTAAALTSSACADTEPDAIALGETSAFLYAANDGTDTQVFGHFWRDSESEAYRFPFDGMVARLGNDETPVPLALFASSFEHTFWRTTGGKLDLVFHGSELNEAVDATVQLPDPFTPVLAQEDVPRGQVVVVSLGQPKEDQELSYFLTGDCIEPRTRRELSDAAELTIEPGEIVPRAGFEGARCDVRLEIHRQAQGKVDAQFGGEASFVGVQSRWVTFETLP